MTGNAKVFNGFTAALLAMVALWGCTEDTQTGPGQITVDSGAKDTTTGADTSTDTTTGPADSATGGVDMGSAKVSVPAGAQLLSLAGNARHFALGSAQAYWTVPATQQVLRVDLGGGPVQLVAKEVGINRPHDIATSDGMVYWAVTNPTLYFLRSYQESAASKATVLTAKPQIDPQVIRDIVADKTHIYFNTGTNPAPNYTGLIRRVEVGEGVAVTLRTWQKEPTDIALNGEHIYWTTLHGPAVQRILKNGSELETVTKQTTGALALVVDGTFAWWCNQPGLSVDVKDGTVMRAAVQGGPPMTVANKQRSPVAMASGTNHIWWVNAGTAEGGWTDGQLVRFERSGKQDPEVVREGLTNPADLALNNSAAFWLSKGATKDDPAALFRLDLNKL